MKNKVKLFEMTVGALFLTPLTENDIDYLLDVFRDNIYLPNESIISIIHNDNPSLYDQLIKLNLL